MTNDQVMPHGAWFRPRTATARDELVTWLNSLSYTRVAMRVAMRQFPNGDVIALMPELRESRGLIASYQHIGQHGAASEDLLNDLPPPDYEDCKPLLEELERIGYTVELIEEALD